MATYLVTGAAGFIASKVCEQLHAAGHTVVAIDNLNDYYDVRLKDYRISALLGANALAVGRSKTVSVYASRAEGMTSSSGRLTFLPIDIEHLRDLEALFTRFKFDAVFNLAARAGVRASMANPYLFLSTNTEGTLNILECQRRFGVKKQILASTSSLYAGCPMPFVEDQPVNTPLSPYAAAKKAAELMAYTYYKLYGLDVSIVRYFTVYGPAGRPDMAPFRFIKWISEGTPVELFGDGSQARDFTYVDDIARGTVLAAKPVGYEIFNLGGGNNPIRLSTILALVEKTTGRKAIIHGQPFHIADVRETWADISKAKRLLGWQPEVSLEEGFQRTIAWHNANAEFVREIGV
jgi:UDP-glucuronate 4-epimerase